MLTAMLLGAGLGVVIVVGTRLLDRSFRRSIEREHAALHALPPTAIAELREGQRVRVIGTAVAAGETTKAPYTGKPCIAYDAHAYLPGDDIGQAHKDKQVLPFRVRDASGTVEVALGHVELELEPHLLEVEQPGFRAFGAGIVERELAAQHGAYGTPARIDHFEDVLEPDRPVAVIGLVTRDDDGKLRLAGTVQQPLVISNLPAALQP